VSADAGRKKVPTRQHVFLWWVGQIPCRGPEAPQRALPEIVPHGVRSLQTSAVRHKTGAASAPHPERRGSPWRLAVRHRARWASARRSRRPGAAGHAPCLCRTGRRWSPRV